MVDSARIRFETRENLFAPIRKSLNQMPSLVRDFIATDSEEFPNKFLKQKAELKTGADRAKAALQSGNNDALLMAELNTAFANFWGVIDSIGANAKTCRATYSSCVTEFNRSRSPAAAALQKFVAANERERDRAMEAAQQKQQAATQWIFRGLEACLLFTVFVTGLCLQAAVRGGRHAPEYQQLELAKHDLRQLSARLIKAQEDERRRLACELHDGIGQTLSVLRMELSHLVTNLGRTKEQAPVPEGLLRAREFAEQAARTTRDISLLLRPSILDDLGIGPALRWQAEEFSRRSGIRSQFHCDVLPDLPDDWKTCVFRVIQEAINNCEKHAGPTMVKISLRIDRGKLIAKVADNGRGFDMTAVPRTGMGGRLGILGMHERAAGLGGLVRIESAPGKGTSIILTLPLSAAAPEAPCEINSEIHAYSRFDS